MKLTRFFAGAAAILVSAGIVLAAGNYETYPIVGQPAFCAATVTGAGAPFGGQTGQGQGTTGAICAQTVPQGPTGQTGLELIPADTGVLAASGGGTGPVQSVTIPSALIGGFNAKKNNLIGGDFNTNLWQRGTTPLSSGTPSSATMTADRWFTYSSGNTVTVSKQTGAADTIPASGLYASMRVNRPSTTNTSAICVGQILDKTAAQDLLGNNGVLSFDALAGAGFSAASSNLNVTIAYYTAADSATPGTNTGTFAAGTITGYQAVVGGVGTGTTGTVASGVATIPISTTWTRYSAYGLIPTANAAGTAVTGAGVTFCYTPVGTGGATDWFEIEGVQLQPMPSAASAAMPNGVIGFTGFERRPASQEARYQLAYSYVITDGAATVRYGMCQATTTALAVCYLQYPEEMRETPTLTVGTAISFGVTIAAGTAQACGTSVTAVAASGTLVGSAVLCTTGATALIAGNASQFTGAATGGLLTFSAEP